MEEAAAAALGLGTESHPNAAEETPNEESSSKEVGENKTES